jgi:hypothetical protein
VPMATRGQRAGSRGEAFNAAAGSIATPLEGEEAMEALVQETAASFAIETS